MFMIDAFSIVSFFWWTIYLSINDVTWWFRDTEYILMAPGLTSYLYPSSFDRRRRPCLASATLDCCVAQSLRGCNAKSRGRRARWSPLCEDTHTRASTRESVLPNLEIPNSQDAITQKYMLDDPTTLSSLSSLPSDEFYQASRTQAPSTIA